MPVPCLGDGSHSLVGEAVSVHGDVVDQARLLPRGSPGPLGLAATLQVRPLQHQSQGVVTVHLPG